MELEQINLFTVEEINLINIYHTCLQPDLTRRIRSKEELIDILNAIMVYVDDYEMIQLIRNTIYKLKHIKKEIYENFLFIPD